MRFKFLIRKVSW